MKLLFALILGAAMIVASGCEKAVTELIKGNTERRRMETAERQARDEVATERRFIDAAERLTREEVTRLEREKFEQQEREKAEKARLLESLPSLVAARIKGLQSKSELLKNELKGIADDRRQAEKAMSSIEDRRGLEYTVYNVMTNHDLNTLAVKYTGSDFSALKSEFTEAVRFHKTSHATLTQSLQQNTEEYQKQVQNVDNGVEAANLAAQNSITSAHANILKRIEKLEKEKREFALRNRQNDPRIEAVDAQLERLNQLLELSGGSTAHMNATVLETSARRKFDRAMEVKESKDTTAISEHQFKGDLYNSAQVYRGRSIDRLLNAMTAHSAVLAERLYSIETALETLEESKLRLNMMEYADLVKLNETVMSDTRTKLGNALTVPAGTL